MGIAGSVFSLFKQQRYIGGKMPGKYFHEDCWPIFEDLFEKLCIDELLGTKIFIAFCSMDADESGTVDIDECFIHFGAKRTKFSERIFFHEEKLIRQAGDIHRGHNFKDFACKVWNFNTYTTEQLCRYIFEIFDVDCEGFVERAEVESMYRMLYDCDDPDPHYIGSVPYDDSGCINKKEFETYFSDFWRTGNGHLVYPAIEFQKKLRSKTGGSLAWDSVMKFRQQHFHTYDDMAKTQEEALQGILAAEDIFKKQKLLDAEKMLELERLRLKAIADAAQRALDEREAQQRAEVAAREAIAPDRFMKRAFNSLVKQKKSFSDIDWTTEDIWQRREAREEIYKTLDAYLDEARKYYAQQDKEIYEMAEGTRDDHLARLEDYIKTNEGRLHQTRNLLFMILKDKAAAIEEKRLKTQGRRKKDTRSAEEMMVEATITEVTDHINALNKYAEYKLKVKSITKEEAMELAIIKPVTLKEFTSEFSFVTGMISSSELKKYRERNYEELYTFHRDKIIAECQEGLDKDKVERERGLAKEEFDVMRFGSRFTRYEYVRDKANARDCYINVDTLEYLHYKTAICEKCDAIFEQSELKCKGCKAPRSAKNMILYRPLGVKDIRGGP